MAKKQNASTEELPGIREVITIERETFASFCKRNGPFVLLGEYGENPRDGTIAGTKLVFESGGTAIDDDPFKNGSFGGRDPADMPALEVLRNRFTYCTVKLEEEKYKYDRFVGEVRQQAEWSAKCPESCPPPPANWREQAEAGKQRMRDLAERGRQVLEELKAVDPELINRRQRETQDAEHHERARKQLGQVQSVLAYSEQLPEAHIGQDDLAQRVRFQH